MHSSNNKHNGTHFCICAKCLERREFKRRISELNEKEEEIMKIYKKNIAYYTNTEETAK